MTGHPAYAVLGILHNLDNDVSNEREELRGTDPVEAVLQAAGVIVANIHPEPGDTMDPARTARLRHTDRHARSVAAARAWDAMQRARLELLEEANRLQRVALHVERALLAYEQLPDDPAPMRGAP